jgi:hypothetical protein
MRANNTFRWGNASQFFRIKTAPKGLVPPRRKRFANRPGGYLSCDGEENAPPADPFPGKRAAAPKFACMILESFEKIRFSGEKKDCIPPVHLLFLFF